MDSFISLAKQGYEAYSESHSNVSKTGGSEYNSPDNQPQGAGRPNFDDDEVVQNAAQNGSGHSSMFAQAMNHVKGNSQEHEDPINEEEVTNSHKEAYERGNGGSLDAGSMGGAAAIQIFKQFTSGGGSGGGSSQNQLISMAMAEASNLFESSGGASSGSKQDAVNSAGMTVMKLLVQSKLSSAMGGGNSGGLGGLMGLASKFI
ncbi:hypothetical protein D9757_004120 [Collybiopsis confluens]|uniref:DUF7721 domain-containing protein n=1 Tax=Collybiopsis confluens TaxID=2823264 RepID=A0A8H5HTZ4_9AGAR|nr:hypothetical protein D9757_004120 [Collybiopsis confluens]